MVCVCYDIYVVSELWFGGYLHFIVALFLHIIAALLYVMIFILFIMVFGNKIIGKGSYKEIATKYRSTIRKLYSIYLYLFAKDLDQLH